MEERFFHVEENVVVNDLQFKENIRVCHIEITHFLFPMLKKKNRDLTRDQVAELFLKDAKTVANGFFRIRWKTTSIAFPQFVVITTLSLHRSAVKRNRLRRQVYEWIRLHFKDWTRGVRVAILTKKLALEAKRGSLESSLEQLFDRVR